MSLVLRLCIVLFVLLIGLAFHLRNDQFIEFDYYLGIIDLPFSFFIVVSLIVGIVLGALASLPRQLRLKRENARLTRQVSINEKELNNLRVIPIKDTP